MPPFKYPKFRGFKIYLEWEIRGRKIAPAAGY